MKAYEVFFFGHIVIIQRAKHSSIIVSGYSGLSVWVIAERPISIDIGIGVLSL
jgi:hypothetical protein